MTPEERFTKIENFLSTVAAHHARFTEQDARFAAHCAELAESVKRHDEEIREIRETQKATAIAFLKMTEAQVTLTEAQAVLTDAHAAVANVLEQVAEAQRATEGKLNALIDTVDRMMRGPDASPA